MSFFLVLTSAVLAQETGLWTDHLPYNSVNDIAVDDNHYYCATNQGMFIFNLSEQEITTRSKLNGLNDIGINSIAYNKKNKTVVIGYKNANVDLLSGNNIINIGDIKRASGYTGKKRINHIITRGDIAWMATGFGIVEIDIAKEIVNATYIIGENGTDLEVYKLAIEENSNRIYAATPNGLYSADMDNPLIFYQFWHRDTLLPAGEINQVATLNGQVFANKVTTGSVEDSVFYSTSNGWDYLPNQGINKKYDLRVVNDFICITNPFTVNFLEADFNLKYIIGPSFYEPGTFLPRCASILSDGKTMLIGNDNNGLIVSEDVTSNRRITPNGPYSNKVFKLAANNKKMYVAPGAIDEIWTNAFLNEGIFELDGYEWKRIPPTEINGIGDVVNVLIDPADNTHVFAAAWGSGILELKDNVLQNVWDFQTSGGNIVGPPGDIENVRTGGIALDDDGNLWVTSSLSQYPLSVRRPDGTWEKFSAGSLAGSTTNVFDVEVNQLGQKWIKTRTKGILVMDDTQGNPVFKLIQAGVGSGNLPNNTVQSFAEDLDGEMWIGTSEGLVVLYSPQNIFQSGKNFDAQPVLFEEDGVVQKLLGSETVMGIAVDGSNKKWFATLNSGVFYTSEDGTETIHHFTTKNSPLISDAVLDVAIDNETGEVYFATAEGIVSFRGSATRGYEDYTDVYAYPNPVRPDYLGPIYIRGLVTNARVIITDVAGNIVFETVADGGQARWDGLTLDGDKVASGVYMAYVTDDLAERTTVTKILVIR